jgi:hypothetical protein
MKNNQRDSLYKYSLRGITYGFMENVKFSDNSLNQRRKEIIDEINELREQFKGWNDIEDTNTAELELLDNKIKIATEHEQSNLKMVELYDSKLKTLRENLGKSKAIILEKNEELNSKIEFLKELNGCKASLETEEANSTTILSVLDEVQKVFSESSLGQPEHLSSFIVKYNDYMEVTDIIDTEQHNEKDFKLSKTSEISNDLYDLGYDKSRLNNDLNNEKYYLIKEIDGVTEQLQTEILAIDEYTNYQKLIKESKEILKKRYEYVRLDKGFKKELKMNLFAKESIGYRKLRIHPQEMLDFERKMNNLSKFINMISSSLGEEDVKDQTIAVNIQNFYEQNLTRLSDMTNILDSMRSKWEVSINLRTKEKELDELFGKAIGYLQGGSADEPSFRKCFISKELSVYMYYMSLFQIIVSKKGFYMGLMNELSIESQTKLIKQLFRDLNETPFNDPLMMNYYSGELVQGGLERSMSNYTFLINQELDIVFEKQIQRFRDKNISWYYSVLNYAGITFEFVMKILQKGSLGILFKLIALAIFAIFALTHVPVAITAFICAFIAILADIFYNWVQDKLEENPWIKEEFDRGVAKLYGLFSENKIYSLDVEAELMEEITVDENLRSSSTDKERFKYYKSKFQEIVSLNNNLISSDSEQMQQYMLI